MATTSSGKVSRRCQGAICQKSPALTRRKCPKSRGKVERIKEDCYRLQVACKTNMDSIKVLSSLCHRLEEENTILLEQIIEYEHRNMAYASQQLREYTKAGNNILAVQSWADRRLQDAQDDLQKTVEQGENCQHELHLQLKALDSKLKDSQIELHKRREYRDREHPLKVLEMAELQRQLYKLGETHQDQKADVEALAHSELQNFMCQQEKLRDVSLEKVVQYYMESLPLSVRRTCLQNHGMKKEIQIQKQVIAELHDQILALNETGVLLQKSQCQRHEKLCRDLLLHMPKCSPDEDVAFDIPVEEDVGI
ncbi:uncharacterized protein C20orf96 homolog [Bombina bombina]|uniref:uncharacterized protein C20orf96 homolog n=1 Tax=Bombina bombina TaxID=8345 RepID=UPI00235ADDC0|nr:uncharacterized protein C20orf96 homolog [Bombina bombina]